MTEHTTKRYNDGEVLSGVQRRRRWTPEEKVRIVEETYLPGMSVSPVARQHGIGAGQSASDVGGEVWMAPPPAGPEAQGHCRNVVSDH